MAGSCRRSQGRKRGEKGREARGRQRVFVWRACIPVCEYVCVCVYACALVCAFARTPACVLRAGEEAVGSVPMAMVAVAHRGWRRLRRLARKGFKAQEAGATATDSQWCQPCDRWRGYSRGCPRRSDHSTVQYITVQEGKGRCVMWATAVAAGRGTCGSGGGDAMEGAAVAGARRQYSAPVLTIKIGRHVLYSVASQHGRGGAAGSSLPAKGAMF